MSLRVIKLGGSLLDWPELPGRLHRWLASQPAAANVLIVGGGPIVDGLRTIDRAQRLTAGASHWLAIGAMSLTARVLAELLPDAVLLDSLDAVDRTSPERPQILDVQPLLRAEQGSANSLPESWDVTSDSIAAYVAHRLEAWELVLLKSTDPPQALNTLTAAPLTADSLARAGYVDAHFPHVTGDLPIRCVNLHSANLHS